MLQLGHVYRASREVHTRHTRAIDAFVNDGLSATSSGAAAALEGLSVVRIEPRRRGTCVMALKVSTVNKWRTTQKWIHSCTHFAARALFFANIACSRNVGLVVSLDLRSWEMRSAADMNIRFSTTTTTTTATATTAKCRVPGPRGNTWVKLGNSSCKQTPVYCLRAMMSRSMWQKHCSIHPHAGIEVAMITFALETVSVAGITFGHVN